MYHKLRRRLPARGARRRLRGPDQADLPDPPRAVRPPLRGLVEPRALPAHPRRPAPDEHRHPRAVGRRGPVAADHARRRSRSATATVNSELTQYLQDSWKAVIDADVDGPNSEPAKIDAGKPLFGQRSLTKRLARTVFFGAAPTIGSAHKGLETQRVFLGTAIPGDVPGNFHSALAALADRATYFYSAGGQVLVRPAGQHLAPREGPGRAPARRGGLRRDRPTPRGPGRRRAATFAGVHVCPEDAADIPDIDEARLVILHPKLTHKRGVGDSDAIDVRQERDRASRQRRTGRTATCSSTSPATATASRSSSARCASTSAGRRSSPRRTTSTSPRASATRRPSGGRRPARRPTRGCSAPTSGRSSRPGSRSRSRRRRSKGRRRRWPSASAAGSATTARSPSQHAAPAIRHQLDTSRGQAVGGRARHRRRALAAVRRVPVHAAAARPRGARRRPHRAAAAVGAGGLRARRRLRRGEREVPRARPADGRRDGRRDRRDADRAARAGEGAARGRAAGRRRRPGEPGPRRSPARPGDPARRPSRRARRGSSAASACRPTATRRTSRSSPTRSSARSGRRPA